MGALSVETVTTAAGLEALASDYERVNRAAKNGLPFALHDWHVVWWSHFRKESVAIKDSLMLKVVRDGAECVGIAPFVVTERPSVGPVRARSVAILGADPYITEIKVPLVDPARGAEVARALADELRRDRGWDWLQWSGLERGSAFAEELARRASLQGTPSVPDTVLDLPGSWDDFRKNLKRNIRESLRHCYNSLKRDGHAFELEVAESPDQVRAHLGTFHRLHGARADLTDTIEHPDRFATDVSKRFLADVAVRLANKGMTKIFVVSIAGAPVAVRIGFVVGESLYLYYSGFDPGWRKYSVMTTCVAEAIRWGIEHGMKTVNLSAGRDVSKTRWGGREVTYDEAVQVQRTMRSRAAYVAYRKAGELQRDPRLAAVIRRVLPKREYA